MVWYGVIWFDVVRAFRVAGLALPPPISFWISVGDLWCGVVWCGVIWFDVVPLFCVHDFVIPMLCSLLRGSFQRWPAFPLRLRNTTRAFCLASLALPLPVRSKFILVTCGVVWCGLV